MSPIYDMEKNHIYICMRYCKMLHGSFSNELNESLHCGKNSMVENMLKSGG